MVSEKTLESPLDSKEIQPVNPKGISPEYSLYSISNIQYSSIQYPILWPTDVKNWVIGKDPDAGKDWRKEEKGKTEDEMVGWRHWLDGHEVE